MGKIYLTKKQEQIIIDKYLQGASQKESGKAVGVGYKIVQRVLKENNISIRTQGESRTLYKVNNDFFKTQTREMAYILGLLGSDGCVAKNKNVIYIELQRQDRDILEKINTIIGNERPVQDYTTGRGYENSKMYFYSKEIKQDLAEYHIIPNKTYETEYRFPEKLKKEFYFDYIRGLFDGDGCIKTTNPTITWQIDTSSKDIAEQICLYLQSFDIEAKISILPKTNISIYRIYCYNKKNCKKLFNLLYHDTNLFLKRKNDKFIELLNT